MRPGNAGAAFVEILVGKSTSRPIDYQVLQPIKPLCTMSESKSGANRYPTPTRKQPPRLALIQRSLRLCAPQIQRLFVCGQVRAQCGQADLGPGEGWPTFHSSLGPSLSSLTLPLVCCCIDHLHAALERRSARSVLRDHQPHHRCVSSAGTPSE